ncbi:hypothetical protein ACHMW6_34875 [Pseudoduganella sp. UC29_106]|uniref:hypothetical protein n=1 Tax=Pseudoduganella sp. UC29_106 TaxID=3374553 RepID=UPI003757766D
MEKKATKATTRVQLELAEKSFERLNALKDKTEAASYAEVMKNALRLYESIIAQHDAGKRLCLKDSNGNITEYEVFC